MKKTYEAPELTTEVYKLNVLIASNCAEVVSNGPERDGQAACSDYKDPFVTQMARSTEPVHNVQFYEDTCDCYTSGGDSGYWQS